MNKEIISWEIEINGMIAQIQFDDLVNSLIEGKISPETNVRRDSLRWLKIYEVPLLVNAMREGNKSYISKIEPAFVDGGADQPQRVLTQLRPAPPQRVYTEREKNERSYQTFKRKQRDEREREIESQKFGNNFSLPFQLFFVLIFSAILSYCWMSYSDYSKNSQPNLSGQQTAQDRLNSYKAQKIAFNTKNNPSYYLYQNNSKQNNYDKYDPTMMEFENEVKTEWFWGYVKGLLIIFIILSGLVLIGNRSRLA
ncbi:MAG TPA: hypothetical protein PKY59_04535 [Pyrinomonadaceae bacterium]|nr:hypothetical protein [Pyrinomonadaceae bacterium]